MRPSGRVRRPWPGGPRGFQVESSPASGASAARGGGRGGENSGPRHGGRESFRAPSRSAGLVGRWRRRFPGSPRPGRRWQAFSPSPASPPQEPEPVRPGGGERRREGERAEVAWCRRRRREEGRRAGREEEEEEAGAVSHAAPGGAARRLRERSETVPWRDGI